jgi:uncharacterized protein YPO0396
VSANHLVLNDLHDILNDVAVPAPVPPARRHNRAVDERKARPKFCAQDSGGCQQLLNRIGEAAPDDADALAQEQDERAEAKEHRALMTADCHRVPAGFINPDLLRQGSRGV